MHSRGDWLEWGLRRAVVRGVRRLGAVRAWDEATGPQRHGRPDESRGRRRAQTVLNNLPDTGGWRDYQWSNSAKLTLTAGKHTLRWSNDQGGGYGLDAFVLTDDPAWRPVSWKRPPVAAGKHLVTIQCEEYKACHGLQITKCGGLSVSSKTRFPFLSGTVKASWAKEPDAEVHVWPSSPHSCRAFNEIAKLDRVDEAEGVIVIRGKETAVEVCSGDRYFVENILESWIVRRMVSRPGRPQTVLVAQGPARRDVAGHRPATDPPRGVPRRQGPAGAVRASERADLAGDRLYPRRRFHHVWQKPRRRHHAASYGPRGDRGLPPPQSRQGGLAQRRRP